MSPRDAFIAAVRAGDREKVTAMLTDHPSLAIVRRDGASAVLIARYHGRHEIVALLRQAILEPDIFEAAALGDRERVAHVLDGDPTLANAVAEDGFGPLGLASFFDHEAVVALLLERGAPVNARQGTSGLGFTPLMEASYNGQVEMVDVLLAHGADRSMRDDNGLTASDYARQNGHEALAGRLAG